MTIKYKYINATTAKEINYRHNVFKVRNKNPTIIPTKCWNVLHFHSVENGNSVYSEWQITYRLLYGLHQYFFNCI